MAAMTAREAAAAAGAKKMDEAHGGTGWADKIDLGAFDIGSVLSCVDAQANNSTEAYSAKSLQKLGIRNEDAHQYGFASTNPIEYGALNEAWRQEILARKSGGESSEADTDQSKFFEQIEYEGTLEGAKQQ